MSPLPWLWLASPFVLIAVISHDPNMRDLVTVHHRRCRLIGWIGVGAMVLGATVAHGVLGTLLFGIGTPVAGLVVWMPREDRGGGGEEGPDNPPPDWDDFERAFWAYVRRGKRVPRRPRAPVG